jgi:flagellar basal-body rod protein FlgB
MPDRVSFAQTFRSLESAVHILEKRHNVIASNMSNLDTPNYQARDIDFRTAITRAIQGDPGIQLKKTDPGHFGKTAHDTPDPEAIDDEVEWNGYNWVQIDREMTKLMENNLRYRTVTQTLIKKINMIREVIREGGR